MSLSDFEVKTTYDAREDNSSYANNLINNANNIPIIKYNSITLTNNSFTQSYTGTISYNSNNNSNSYTSTPDLLTSINVGNISITENNSSQFSYTTKNSPNSIDFGSTIGSASNMSIVNGNPALSYSFFSGADLKYIRALDKDGRLWDNSTFIDTNGSVGLYNSICVVNGNPAIAYYDTTNGNLKYVRANDINGTSWGTPITVDSSANDVGKYASMIVLPNGQPAISYYDNTSGDLKYAYSSSNYGVNVSDWSIPIIVDSINAAGLYCSLQLVNNIPCIAYYSYSVNSQLLYVRATNNIGSAWNSPVIIESYIGSTIVDLCCISLKEIDGKPAIAYAIGNNTNLKYIIAVNSIGSIWTNPSISLDTNTYSPFLNIINGKPAIAYNTITRGIRYIIANNTTGVLLSDWNTPIVIDSSPPFFSTSSKMSLLEVNSKPAISYYDAVNGDLKYARSSDIKISYSSFGR